MTLQEMAMTAPDAAPGTGPGTEPDRATVRLTAAQAMMRWLSVQMIDEPSGSEAIGQKGQPSSSEAVGQKGQPSGSEAVGQKPAPSGSEAAGQKEGAPSGSAAAGQTPARFIAGVWAIFGHGNVAGIGEALYGIGEALPTWRGQNEQTMAHAAIAFAKTKARRQAMAVTASIGPGSTNMVTAAALAHVNRLPVLFLCGDVFANRRPDPVLQQIEDFDDGTVSANDCFRPVVRYFDRITRPEQLMTALPRALAAMTDPADCGPVCLAFCQDVQAEAFDWPEAFFAPRVWRIRRPEPDPREVEDAVAALKAARRPLIVAGGGVRYAGAEATLAAFAAKHAIPFVETQAGKGALSSGDPLNFGSPGVTGSACGNALAAGADLILGLGTRFQDFTTGSWTVFGARDRRLVSVNLAGYDAVKHGALPVVGDAKVVLERLSAGLGQRRFAWADPAARLAWL